MKLIVSEVFEMNNLGIAVFFENDPQLLFPITPHIILITNSDGEELESTVYVECAYKVPLGEVMTLLFPELKLNQIPKGITVYILGKMASNHNGTKPNAQADV